MHNKCEHCGQIFEIHPKERELYTSLDVPDPVECPACRRQRRLMFRNFFHLYHRSCDLTGKKIVSMYDTDAPFPVYEMHEWWSDKWDPLSYGFAFDPVRPFFDQVALLHRTVPRMNLVSTNSENTDYCNMSVDSRNCYLVFGNVENEDCSYGHIVWQSKNCHDCLYTYRSQYCYECIDCVDCHTLSFSRDCDNCAASMFLIHCVGCRNCFGCTGLKNKEYCIFNEPHSREEYEAKMAAVDTGGASTVAMVKERMMELQGKEIVKEYHGRSCENVTGDYLYNCRNIVEGFDLKNCEDCLYGATLDSFSDSLDCNFCGLKSEARAELCYQCVAVGPSYNLIACHTCQGNNTRLSYCDNCHGCSDCFGCAGLRNARFCVLNKQYTEVEYMALIPKIIDHMRKTPLRSSDGSFAGYEWGQFFPRDLSSFCYNETIAQEYFPMTQEEVMKKGWRWKEEKDEEKQDNYLGPLLTIPDRITDVSDDITKQILRCEVTGKLFKITQQELQFYRDMRLPLPRKCFMQRQRERFAQRNPRRLWKRTCMKCGKSIETTYAPERPETVYCESCYVSAVY